MARVLTAAVVLLFPALLFADESVSPNTTKAKWYTAAEWSLFACHALDDGYTQRLLGTGQFHETSPLLGRFSNPGIMIGVKFSLAFGQAKAMRTVARSGHPVVAAVTNAAVAGVMCGAAWHNARLYREYVRGY